MERLQAAETAADRYEAKYRAAKGNLQHTHDSCTQQSSELEHLSEALFSEQELARSSQQAVEELSSRLSTVQVTHAQQRHADMAVSHAFHQHAHHRRALRRERMPQKVALQLQRTGCHSGLNLRQEVAHVNAYGSSGNQYQTLQK